VDALLRARMRSEITRIIRDVGGTMMLVTHDQTEAMTMGEVLAVMNDGAIEQVGTPREIYDTPKNTFIARFIGSPRMNLVEPGTGLHRLISKRLAGRLKGELSGVIFGIRPEDIDISAGKKKGGGFEGEVRYIEELGHESHVTAATGDAEVTVRMGADEAASLPAPGGKVALTLNDDAIHLFDNSTGERIENRGSR
jgi:ABC-type sugar transport system ATPase subunit